MQCKCSPFCEFFTRLFAQTNSDTACRRAAAQYFAALFIKIVKDACFQNLPDTQNQGANAIRGANVPIQHVGIQGFRIPLTIEGRAGVETAVDAGVDLPADRKGINMSRLMRVFYRYAEQPCNLPLLNDILLAYQQELTASAASLLLRFNLPLRQRSLRSDMEGWQYYRCGYEAHAAGAQPPQNFLLFEFVYSSACPCAADLAEHARAHKGIAAIPHSQRSTAALRMALRPGHNLTFAALRDACAQALQTETQVMVRRADEQAFAELNGAHTMFVEDAARLLYGAVAALPEVGDFRIGLAHHESLHSHDAVARIERKGCEASGDESGSR